ncbi:MAG TPA: fatty acid desaturase [Polyangiaceae bacterium]
MGKTVGYFAFLRQHPFQQFKKDRRFYLKYDAFYLVVSAALVVVMMATRFRSLGASVEWKPWHFVIGCPLVLYALICAHLWIHNATHGNFPKSINRLIGEVLGVIVFVRYASWDIVHMRHHRFSDDRDKDPHPTFPSYLRSFFHSIVYVERQLQQQYCDVWGDTEENRRYERFRAKVSYGTNVALALAWYLFLGPVGFFAFWLPFNLIAAAFVGHFNWSTHNGMAGGDYRPVNLNHGYFWLGNKLFTGIYFHANHHKRPNLFNPMRWDTKFGPEEACVDTPERKPITA